MPFKDVVQIFSNVVTALATILAGVWAYYRFVKGRVFEPRLTLTAKAHRLRIRTSEYVLSTVELSNVGLSKIDFNNATLRVCSLSGNAEPDLLKVPKRVWLDTLGILLAHSSIESGEVLTEQNLLVLPSGHDLPILLDFRVVAQGMSFTASIVAEPAAAESANDN